MTMGTRWGYIGPRDAVRDLQFERDERDPRSRVVDSIDFDAPAMQWLKDLVETDESQPQDRDAIVPNVEK